MLGGTTVASGKQKIIIVVALGANVNPRRELQALQHISITVLPLVPVSRMNCPNITMAEEVKLFQVIVYIPTLLLGVAFNGLAVWVFCCKMKKWTETRIYMINLIISDCSLLFTFPFRLYAYNHEWNLGTEMCDAIIFIYFLNVYMSILIITMVAVDRYIAIKHPMKAKSLRSPVKAAITCLLLWIILIAFRTYLLVHDLQVYPQRESPRCLQKSSTRPMKRILYFTVFGFILPFIVLSFCSIQVIRTLRQNIKTNPDSEQPIRKAIQIVAANLAVFIVCFIPTGLGNLIRYGLQSSNASCSVIQSVQTFEHIGVCVSHLNCVLDAICYYFVAKEFWEASHLPFPLKYILQPKSSSQDTSF